jgi:hypothetical protein
MQSRGDYCTRWKSARFRVRQILNPYPDHYSPAFAFSILPYLLSRQFSLRITCQAEVALAENQAYHVPHDINAAFERPRSTV